MVGRGWDSGCYYSKTVRKESRDGSTRNSKTVGTKPQKTFPYMEELCLMVRETCYII